MSFARPFRIALALGLIVTISPKVLIASVAPSSPLGPPDVLPIVSEFLSRQGFRPDNGRVRRWPYVEASANDCTMRVVELAWNGWNRDVLAVVAPLASHQYFAYQGTLYESYPYVRAAIMSLFDRVRARVGRLLPQRPVLGIAASEACPVHDMPWANIVIS